MFSLLVTFTLPTAMSVKSACTSMRSAEAANIDLDRWTAPKVWVSLESARIALSCDAERENLLFQVTKTTQKREAFERIESVHKAFCSQVRTVSFEEPYLLDFCGKPLHFDKSIDYLNELDATFVKLSNMNRTADRTDLAIIEPLFSPSKGASIEEHVAVNLKNDEIKHRNALRQKINSHADLIRAVKLMKLLINELCTWKKLSWHAIAANLFNSVTCPSTPYVIDLKLCETELIESDTDVWFGYCRYKSEKYAERKDKRKEQKTRDNDEEFKSESCAVEVASLLENKKVGGTRIDPAAMDRVLSGCRDSVDKRKFKQLEELFNKQNTEEQRTSIHERCQSFMDHVSVDLADAEVCAEDPKLRAQVIEAVKDGCWRAKQCFNIPKWLLAALSPKEVEAPMPSFLPSRQVDDLPVKESRLTMQNALLAGTGLLSGGYLLHNHFSKKDTPVVPVESNKSYTLVIVLVSVLAVILLVDIYLYVKEP